MYINNQRVKYMEDSLMATMNRISCEQKSARCTHENVGDKKESRNVTKFADVIGLVEAKKELEDIVNFLKNPKKFKEMGAALPKGYLLTGKPGVGKTLLAKAVSGESNVPFLSSARANVDVNAAPSSAEQLNELFAVAKKNAPCIVFIDEIDSIGGERTPASEFKHASESQTLNMLLTLLDGFSSDDNVFILAATNRVADLDPALLRPGRFDIVIKCDAPILKYRIEMFQYYLRNKLVNGKIDLDLLGKETYGFTGADIKNIVNSAAIKAASAEAVGVDMVHLTEARDRLLMGLERLSMLPSKEEQQRSAIHEAGHVVVSYFTPHAQQLHRVTIVPRGDAAGQTAHMPKDDGGSTIKLDLLAKMDCLFGGRVAEEMLLPAGHISTGAAHDFRAATDVARKMTRIFGMGPNGKLTSLKEVWYSGHKKNDEIDNEIDILVEQSVERVRVLLKLHKVHVENVVKALVENISLSSNDISEIIEGKKNKIK